jgi:two-component system nitrogen regulation response regulator GlnG
MTGFALDDNAIRVMQCGAFEFLLKPVEQGLLQNTVARALASRNSPEPLEAPGPAGAPLGGLVARSVAMLQVFKDIGRVAALNVNVLLLGESGTGKELAARALHRHSSRKDGPFVAVNCASIPEHLLENELFGHEKGAFTGAERQHRGKFEQAHGGTFFLDEIGELSGAAQPKLLRVLQEATFERIGGTQTIKTSVRVIAATNADLHNHACQGRFRLDLLQRLNTFTIRMPPLRERAGDVALLAEHFRQVFNRKLGKSVGPLAPAILELLEAHSWPGNVRELAYAIQEALIRTAGHVLTPEVLPEAVRQRHAPVAGAPARTEAGPTPIGALVQHYLTTGEKKVRRKVLEEVDRIVLPAVLERVGGKLSAACDRLGMSLPTLRNRLCKLGLNGYGRCEKNFHL